MQHSNQHCSRDGPKPGQVGIDENVTVSESTAYFLRLWQSNQNEAAATDGIARIHVARSDRHFGAGPLTLLEIAGTANACVVDIPGVISQSIVRRLAAIAEVQGQRLDPIHLGPRQSIGLSGHEFAYAGHPAGRDDKRQSQIRGLPGMREHTFLHKRETRDVNVVTPAPKRRLGNTIPQQHHRFRRN